MLESLKNLDRILRGEATQLAQLREGTIGIPAGGLSLVIVVLGMLYGVCMGGYAVFSTGGTGPQQLLASTVKVPALFLLTLVVTFPSLYVFNALVGSRLNVRAVSRLLVAAIGVNLAVLASLGPIVAFFAVCTDSYSFMVLLNVVVFAISGGLGLTFLLQTLHRLSIASRVFYREPEEVLSPAREDAAEAAAGDDADEPAAPETIVAEAVEEPGALDPMEGHVLGRHVKTVFACWIVVYGLVGAQMSWILRPYIGSPGKPFEWFRPRESNFFEAVWRTLQDLFALGG